MEIDFAQAMMRLRDGEIVECSFYGGEFHGSKIRIIPDRSSATEPWKDWQMQCQIGGNWYLMRKSVNTMINGRYRLPVDAPPKPEQGNIGIGDVDDRLRQLEAEISDIRSCLGG